MTESLGQKVSKAMFWNTVLFPLKTVISLLTSLIVVNGLRVTGFGVYSTLLAAAVLIGQYTDLGLERSLPKFLPEVEARFGRTGVRLFLQWLLGFKFVLLLLVIAGLQIWAPFFTSFFKLEATGPFLGIEETGPLLIGILSALVVLGSLSNIMVQILFTYFRQKAYNLLEILNVLVRPLLTAALVLLGLGVTGALISLLVVTVVILGLQVWQARLAGREIAPSTRRVRTSDLLALLPRFWPYALLIYLINVSATLYTADVALTILTGLGDLPGAAVLALGVRYVNEFIRFLVAPQTGIQIPLFTRLFARDDRATLRTAYSSFTRLFTLALIPAGVGLVLFSRGLIQLLFLEEFGAAAVVVVVLIAGDFLDSMLGSVPHNILMAFERYRPVIASRLLVLVTLPLLLWLAPLYGALGAAVAMAVARLAAAAVVAGYAIRAFRLVFPWRFLGRVVLAAAAMTAVLLPILWAGGWGAFGTVLPEGIGQRVVGLLILAGLILVGAGVFLVVFKRLGGLEPEDRARLEELRFPLKRWILRWL